jgi:hypothetical protein
MKCAFFAFLLLFATVSLFSLDLSVRPRGFGFFPVGEVSIERFTPGGGVDIMLDADLSSLWPMPWGKSSVALSSLGYGPLVEGGFAVSPLASGAESALQLYSAGLGGQAFFYPLSRLFLRLDTVLGVYRGIMPESASPGFWWRIGPEAGFRFTPSFIVAADAGFRQYLGKDGALLNQGISLGITAHLTLETGGGSSGVVLRMEQDGPLYPVFFPLYRENHIGVLRITNNENAEIRNVRASFRADNYTASELNCGNLAFIGRGNSGELPFFADLSPGILNFTENGRISGEVVIRYTMLGRERETSRGVSVQVYNRNMYPLGVSGDRSGLAAFASPNAPEILEFSRYVMGLARANRRAGLNENMQTGLWLFEGIRAANIGLRIDSGEESPSSLIEVQFPAQTLVYRSGSVLDIALLYGSVLEASGVPSGIIPLEGDCLVAFYLGLNRDDAATTALFNGPGSLLFVGDEVWLPLAVSKLDAGFSAAWVEGVRRINAILAGEEQDAELVVFESAWAVYPPAPLPSLGVQISRPEARTLSTGVEQAIVRYIADELGPMIRDLNQQITAGPSGSLYNRLGNLYLRSNRLVEAKVSYERAAGMGSVLAMVNRGSMALNENDWNGAERWFRQALAAEPLNAAALRGLEQLALRRRN